ncbi:lipoprotein [Dactylosporangium cerinum]|uniref:Lipoprotein n=1 Tax=Dactylosporangium cerinum TaxID=1434730 RepID=A0ABV9VRF2_9ACTN
MIPLFAVAASLALLGACADDPATPRAQASGTPVPAVSVSASGAAPSASAGAAADPAFVDPAPAAAAGKIGPGTECAIPATLPIAAKWTPKDAAFYRWSTGGLTLRCEIDAKPAGVIGFIRVFTYEGTDAQQALAVLMITPLFGGKTTGEREITIGGKSGVEAALAANMNGPGRAFATGGVLVVWRGADEDEFKEGLPAYVLARTAISF